MKAVDISCAGGRFPLAHNRRRSSCKLLPARGNLVKAYAACQETAAQSYVPKTSNPDVPKSAPKPVYSNLKLLSECVSHQVSCLVASTLRASITLAKQALLEKMGHFS